MINFLKGIVAGIGGIAPGLSGSVLLVILGLYEKCVEAIGTVFKNFKKNVIFLIPIILGMGVGVLLFSKIVDYLLGSFEMYTRFAFLGLVIGTIPMLFKEVRKKDFKKTNYIIMVVAAIAGLTLMFISKNLNVNNTVDLANVGIFKSAYMGLMVAASMIIPGVDSAVILSALGLYEIYVKSIATLNFAVLIPAGVGLGFGALIISYIMNKLLKKYYGITFSIIFGLFISIIPSVVNESCKLGINIQSFIAIAIMIIGFFISYFLERLKKED